MRVRGFVKDSKLAFVKSPSQTVPCCVLRHHYGPWSAHLEPQGSWNREQTELKQAEPTPCKPVETCPGEIEWASQWMSAWGRGTFQRRETDWMFHMFTLSKKKSLVTNFMSNCNRKCQFQHRLVFFWCGDSLFELWIRHVVHYYYIIIIIIIEVPRTWIQRLVVVRPTFLLRLCLLKSPFLATHLCWGMQPPSLCVCVCVYVCVCVCPSSVCFAFDHQRISQLFYICI